MGMGLDLVDALRGPLLRFICFLLDGSTTVSAVLYTMTPYTAQPTDFSYFFVGCENDRMNCVQHMQAGELVIPISAGKPSSEFWEKTRPAVEMPLPIDATEPSRQRKDMREEGNLVSDESEEFKGAMPKIGTNSPSLIPSFRCEFSWVQSLLLRLSHPHGKDGERT